MFDVVPFWKYLTAFFIGHGNVGYEAFNQRRFPDFFLRRKWVPDLPVVFKKCVHQHLLIKTPPAAEAADGAFEMIFPVDFSLVVSLE
jgi:hypothetical protein